MSSRRAAAAAASSKGADKAMRSKRVAAVTKHAAKPGTKSPAKAGHAGIVSDAALRLAAEVERGLAAGTIDVLTPQAVQALMAAACNVYSAQVEAGQTYFPLKPQSVPPTAVMATASGILKSANLAVFELGMWQSWTGR